MTDATLDFDLEALEQRTSGLTASILKALFPFQAFPRVDVAGIVRHGIGRPIEKRPLSREVAEVALMHDITTTQTVLRGRVFELVARHPDFEDRLPYLYAIADIFGAEMTRSWAKLWQLLNARDLEGAASELVVAQWDRVMGSDEPTRRAVFQLVNRLQLGAPITP